MKQIDLSQAAKLDNGKGVNLAVNGPACTWAEVAYDALMFPSEKIMKAASLADKRLMFSIATRIKSFPANVSLQPEEKEMLVIAVGEKFMPAVVGAFELQLNHPTELKVAKE